MTNMKILTGNQFIIPEAHLQEFFELRFHVESAKGATLALESAHPIDSPEAAAYRYRAAEFYQFVMRVFSLSPDNFQLLHDVQVDMSNNPMKPVITFLHQDPNEPVATKVTRETVNNTVQSTADLLQDPLQGQDPQANLDPNNPLLTS